MRVLIVFCYESKYKIQIISLFSFSFNVKINELSFYTKCKINFIECEYNFKHLEFFFSIFFSMLNNIEIKFIIKF